MISAGTQDQYNIQNLNVEKGRYFVESETRAGSLVTVLGATIAEGLFPNSDPLGKYVNMLGRKVQVVGILKKKEKEY